MHEPCLIRAATLSVELHAKPGCECVNRIAATQRQDRTALTAAPHARAEHAGLS